MNQDIIAAFLYHIDFRDWALASSKALQLLFPLILFVLIRELLTHRGVFRAIVTRIHPDQQGEVLEETVGVYERRFGRILGFLTWKIGCDLGFFLLIGDNWLRALTLSGLIPYTIAQYLIYRLFGQKMLLGGMLNPFRREKYTFPPLKRRRPIQRAVSKMLHEDMNATSVHAQPRRVLLKPLMDYFAVVVAWSVYNMGIFWVQSGELNGQPFIHFEHTVMLGMYVGGVLSFIIGFNLGQRLSSVVAYRIENILERSSVQNAANPLQAPIWQRSLRWRVRSLLDKYDFGMQWIASVISGIIMVALLTPLFFNAVQNTAHWIEVQRFNIDAAYSSRAAIQTAGAQRLSTLDPTGYSKAVEDYIRSRTAYYELEKK